MDKCKFCKKEEDLEEINIYINNEFITKLEACPECAKIIKDVSADEETFANYLINFTKNLADNWEKGTKDNTKEGSIIMIVSLAEEKDKNPNYVDYIGAKGVVNYIDDLNHLYGSWGGLSILPDVDSWLVLKEK